MKGTRYNTIWAVHVCKEGTEIRSSSAEVIGANEDLHVFVKAKILNLFSIGFYLGKNLNARRWILISV